MTAPLITTIIPTYNRSRLLKQAIESVLSQTYPHFKLVILDNFSEDDTELIVKKFQAEDPRIQYIRHAYNIGMMKNYEYGFSRIGTPYFHFLSDDDFLLPDFYSQAVRVFTEHPDLGFYAGSTKIVSSADEILRIPNDLWIREGYQPKITAAEEIIGKYPIPTTVLFAQHVIEEVPPDFSNARFWDCDFLLHIALKFPVYIDKKVVGFFISHEHSFSRSSGIDIEFASFQRMISRIEEVHDIGLSVKNRIEEKIKEDCRYVFRSSLLQLIVQKKMGLVKQYLGALRSYYDIPSSFSSVLLFYGWAKILPYGPESIAALLKIKRYVRARKMQLFTW